MYPFIPLTTVLFKSAAFTQVPTAGFDSPLIGPSNGGGAECITGSVQVAITSNNIKLNYTGPANQLEATETIVEYVQTNPKSILGGANPITGTYSIYAKLCLPSNSTIAREVQTVQFLTHGDTLDSTYWDIAPGYSYVDAAATAGYATFSYDRIGVGKSEHPDPIQVVQGPLQVDIAHFLVSSLRAGQIGGYSFNTVVGFGHSAGSTVTQGQTTRYREDFDAIILTGTSTEIAYVTSALASFNFIIANTDPSGKFQGINNGYLTQATQEGIQFAFFRHHNFDPKILDDQFANKQGQLFTLDSIVAPSTEFTGPVDVVIGENDFVFCGGDCTYPSDQSAAVVPALYPAASNGSQHYLVPGAGHVTNGHHSAAQAFAQMTGFL